MSQQIELSAVVAEHQVGQRLDQALAEMFQDYSRSRLKEWILAGFVTLNGKVTVKAREKMQFGDQVVLNAEVEEEVRYLPQDIALDIIYEDDDILVINKPAGIIVSGNQFRTVENALLHNISRSKEKDALRKPRAVHRLDSPTSGLLLVAKTALAHLKLSQQFEAKTISNY